jgi:hypothetical protein
MARAAAALAAGAGIHLPDGMALWRLAGGRPVGEEPEPCADPATELGRRMEAGLTAGERRRGAHYTPPALADRLAELALPTVDPRRPPTVCDPSCGAGAPLLAAARRLAASGVAPGIVARDLLWGADLDPLAAAVAEAAVALWSGGEVPGPGHVVAGDPLRDGARAWPSPPPAGFGAVVGNPPFQGQLASATARTREAARELRARFGSDAVAPYVDTAALFLLVAAELAGTGAHVALVQPTSVIAGRDAGPVRALLAEQAGLVRLWAPAERLFNAEVQVCVPLLVAGRAGPRDWSGLVAAAQGVPPCPIERGPLLGSVAEVVAGFRDEYYGLVPHVREASGDGSAEAPLITSGLIDLGCHRWGERPVRFAKRTWSRPVVDVVALRDAGGRAAAYADRVRRPKVVVASQTRVVEAAADPAGALLPSTPVISIVPARAEDTGPIAALLASPAVSAWTAARLAGTGLAPGALRITGRALAEVPLPRDADAWQEGSAAFAAWVDAGSPPDAAAGWAEPLLAAHGIEGDAATAALRWWHPRALGGGVSPGAYASGP